MVKLKNILKDENTTLKTGQDNAENKHKKLKEKLRETKHELEACLKLQSEQQAELENARDRINVRIYSNISSDQFYSFQFSLNYSHAWEIHGSTRCVTAKLEIKIVLFSGA